MCDSIGIRCIAYLLFCDAETSLFVMDFMLHTIYNIRVYVCFQFSRVTTILTTVIIIIGLLKRDETFAFNGSTSSIKSIREHFLRCFYITFHIYICIRLTCALYMRLRQHGICIYIIIIINVRLLGMFRQNKQ